LMRGQCVAPGCRLWQVIAMKWDALLALLGRLPLLESSMLLAGPDSPAEVRRQISRWVASGRLIQIRRGLYALAPPYARESPSPFAVASRLRGPSYVSLQSAMAYHGVIPESVAMVTSVTTGRPGRMRTPLGDFTYRHLRRSLFWGYREIAAGRDQKAFMADPEKALLDLFCLTPGPVRRAFVSGLRLAPGGLDLDRLRVFARRSASPKLIRAAVLTARLLQDERRGEVTL
jgi:predicted transcriptional regulator of viral defense system